MSRPSARRTPIDVPMAGELLSLRASLGMAVQAGDVIAELDATADRLRVVEAQATLAGLHSRFERLGRQIDARQSQRQNELASSEAAAAVAETHNDEAIAALDFARGRSERLARLAETGGTSAAEVLKANADVDALIATQKGWVSEVLRLRLDAHARDAQATAEIEELTNDRAAVAADIETARDHHRAHRARGGAAPHSFACRGSHRRCWHSCGRVASSLSASGSSPSCPMAR
jgi:multidrug resistance efflux pump